MKSFEAFITEAEAVPERQMDIFRDRPQKPFAEPSSTQMSIPGLGKKKIEKLNNPKPNPKYYNPDGTLKPNAVQTYIQGRMAREYNRPGVKLTPEIKARLDSAKQTFANAATDSKAAEQVAQWTKEFEAKHGRPPTSSPTSSRNTPQGKAADAKFRADLELDTTQGADAAQQAAKDMASDDLVGTRKPRVDSGSSPQALRDLSQAVDDVPSEPQLPRVTSRQPRVTSVQPRVTGGQPRVTDRGTPANPYSQAELKREIINRRGRKVTLPRMPQLVSDAPGAPAQGRASIPLPGEVAKPQLPQPTRRQTVTAVQNAVTRNATQQGAAASATSQAGMNNWQRYLATNPTARNVVGGLRNLGRGLTALSAGLSFKDKYDQAKAAGASDTRATIRGGVSAAADVIGGLTGGAVGGKLGVLGGAVTGPGAVVTGTAGAITGGATGANVLRGVADQTFTSLAGPTQQQLDKQRQSNRKKFSDLNLPATNVANNRGIVTGKDGVERVGVRTYRPDGSSYYNVPVRPDTNPISRLAQDMNIPFLSGYYQRQADQQRQQRVKAQKAASR